MELAKTPKSQPISRMTNPMIRKLSHVEAYSESEDAASYGGVAVKTILFLLCTVLGMAGYFVLHTYFGKTNMPIAEIAGFSVYQTEMYLTIGLGIGGAVCSLIAWLARPLVPVLGIIYSLAQGYVITIVSSVYAAEYHGIVLYALILTLLIVFSMLLLYTSGLIKVNHRFKAVVSTLFFTSLLGGVGLFLLHLIWPANPITPQVYGAGVIGIAASVISIIIAALFLISDFDTIKKTVEQGLPKKYEWIAAFGLVITVLWIYMKVLSLLGKLQQNNK